MSIEDVDIRKFSEWWTIVDGQIRYIHSSLKSEKIQYGGIDEWEIIEKKDGKFYVDVSCSWCFHQCDPEYEDYFYPVSVLELSYEDMMSFFRNKKAEQDRTAQEKFVAEQHKRQLEDEARERAQLARLQEKYKET